MSATKRGKQKQQAEVSEEEDFETFVRESLGQLSKGQKQIIQDISNLKAKVKLNETAVHPLLLSSALSAAHEIFRPLTHIINLSLKHVIGCYYWNDIPLSIRDQTTKKLFKRALFNYYLAQY